MVLVGKVLIQYYYKGETVNNNYIYNKIIELATGIDVKCAGQQLIKYMLYDNTRKARFMATYLRQVLQISYKDCMCRTRI